MTQAVLERVASPVIPTVPSARPFAVRVTALVQAQFGEPPTAAVPHEEIPIEPALLSLPLVACYRPVGRDGSLSQRLTEKDKARRRRDLHPQKGRSVKNFLSRAEHRSLMREGILPSSLDNKKLTRRQRAAVAAIRSKQASAKAVRQARVQFA
jgi:hypothetical protein